MLKASTGEFAIFNEKGTGICFYRAYGKYHKDIFNKNNCETPTSIEITKDEYLKKLNVFADIVKRERI